MEKTKKQRIEKEKKSFWKNPRFWIIGIGFVLIVTGFLQNLDNLSILLVLGALMAGLIIGTLFNMGVHFFIVNVPILKKKILGQEYYYGQFGQDKWIIEDIFDFKEKGFFIELAAGDGINKSNTYILEKKFKWKGICIEANNILFEKLKSNRNCICVNVCVDDSIKKVKFTINKGLLGGIIDKDTDNKDLINSDKFIYKETIPLVDILIKHKTQKIIDYFSLDVEGLEYRILKNFPFDKYIFLAMSIERPNKELTKLLRDNGYIKVGSNPCDKLFINERFIELQNLKPRRRY